MTSATQNSVFYNPTANNRDSFAVQADKRIIDRPNITEDSENNNQGLFMNRLNQNALLTGVFSQTGPFSSQKAIESQTFLKGLETPREHTELYEDCEIFHD